jgi:hypothetical protein
MVIVGIIVIISQQMWKKLPAKFPSVYIKAVKQGD